MADATNFIDHISPYVLDCPEPLIVSFINQTIDEFCRKSGAWKIWEDVTTEAGTAGYAIAAGVTGKPLVLLDVIDSNDSPLTESSGQSFSDPNIPQFFRLSSGLLTFFPTPDGAYLYKVRMVVVPDKLSIVLPDDLADMYRFVIVAGTLAKILAMPEKTWSNPQTAMFQERMFQEGINEARINTSICDRILP